MQKASDCARKQTQLIQEFLRWVEEVTGNDDFDDGVLRSLSYDEFSDDSLYQTEALTEIEYGNEVDIDGLEKAINYFKNR